MVTDADGGNSGVLAIERTAVTRCESQRQRVYRGAKRHLIHPWPPGLRSDEPPVVGGVQSITDEPRVKSHDHVVTVSTTSIIDR